jgi:hypothetical protein
MVHLPGGLNVNVGLLNYAKWIQEVSVLSSRMRVSRCRLVDTQRTIECRVALPSGSRFDNGRMLRDE